MEKGSMTGLAVKVAKKLEILSAISCRLTVLTGKSKTPIHPKHLIKRAEPEYTKYLKKGYIVLDLGCHAGENSIKISNKVKKVFAVDYDNKQLGFAKKQISLKKIKNIILKKVDAEKVLPFKDNHFDMVLFLDVLEHLHNRSTVMKEVYRILKKNGLLALIVPNRETSWKKLQKKYGLFFYSDPDHKIEFTQQEIKKICKETGFKVEKIIPHAFDSWTAPLIDLVGGFSLDLYKRLNDWKNNKVINNPKECIGFLIIAKK